MVRKYQTFIKLLMRMISKTKSRFISIFVITLVGSAFFTGLRISPTVMNRTTDAYLDQQNYADLTLIPTYGVTDEDIKEIKKIDGIESVKGIYYFDAQILMDKDYDGVTVYSYTNDFNSPYLVEGRLIENEDECLVDHQYRLARGLKIGDEITLENDNGSHTAKIVGFIKDVRYVLYYKRGSNSYGNGTSAGYVIMHENACKPLALNQDLVELLGYDHFYNEAVISLFDSDEFNVFNSDYDEYLNRIEADIQEVMEIRLNKTYQELIKEKKALLEEPLKEYEDGLRQYENGKLEFETQISSAELQLVEGRIALLEGRKQLVEAQGQFVGMDEEIDEIIGGLQTRLTVLYDQLIDLKENLNDQDEENDPDLDLPMLPDNNPDLDELIDVNESIDGATDTIIYVNTTLDQLNEMASGLLQLENAKLQLDKAELELDVGEQTLTMQKELGLKELEDAKLQLDEAKVLLDEAQAQIDEIPTGTYYLLDQNMNEGLVSFKGDSDRIGVIGELFPFMFFLVAALVCLTTMTRMVEEQRAQCGTLRALGYTRLMIILQYVVYATIPTLLGSIIGYFIGALIIPMIIYGLYSMMMYDVPLRMIYCVDPKLITLSTTLSVCITLMATLFSCIKEMTNVPAVLMRPKAPKLGKRILLERITWIWKRLSFNQKVTMRNIFRYKKRFLMSVIGIAGCAGLILTGFGIQYSITDMTVYQYDELTLYDGSVTYRQKYSLDDTLELRDDLKVNEEITEILFTRQENIVSFTEKDEVETILLIPSSATKIDRFLVLRDPYTKKELTLPEEGAIISQKLSEMLGVTIGDTVQFTYQDRTYDVVVDGITENYIAHYMYMSSQYASSILKEDIKYNGACFNIKDTNEALENKIGQNIMKIDQVASVSFMSNAGGAIVKQLKSVSIVTYILIISAGLLAFVVLYNLTNININERMTEIATIKVLGFRDKEVYDYVFRENILLSLIGTFLGLIFGIFLHKHIMSTVEVELIMFVRNIKPISYLYAVVLTMSFTLLINRFMRRVLDHVDMVTSLKSVE